MSYTAAALTLTEARVVAWALLHQQRLTTPGRLGRAEDAGRRTFKASDSDGYTRLILAPVYIGVHSQSMDEHRRVYCEDPLLIGH
eukprot:scaffold382_cov380-Prasinococcus_capsulatus_cf.AAC.16